MPEITAPVLTVHQPWASAIAYGGKDVDNHNRRTKYKGLVFIHAAKTEKSLDLFDPTETRPDGSKTGCYLESIDSLVGTAGYEYPRGRIIAVADLYECTGSNILGINSDTSIIRRSHWWIGPYGWWLRDVRPIKPIAWKGSQGFKHNQVTMEVEWL